MQNLVPAAVSNDDAASNPLRLVRTDKLLKITKNGKWDEYVLNRQPQSLEELVDAYEQSLIGNGKVFLWITDKSFCIRKRSGDELAGLPVYEFEGDSFEFSSKPRDTWRPDFRFVMAGLTARDAFDGMEYLANLPDSFYDTWSFYGYRTNGARRYFYLSGRLLEMILATKPRYLFSNYIFNAAQSRALASAGTKTTIELQNCKFEDDGAAFVQAYVDSGALGPANIVVSFTLSFSADPFYVLLNQDKLDSMSLDCARSIDGSMMKLIQCIREGRGPKRLRLNLDAAHFPPEQVSCFMDALRGNRYLENLQVVDKNLLVGLPSALMDNKGLTELCIDVWTWGVQEGWFKELLKALSTHPAIHTVAFHSLGVPVPGERMETNIQDIAEMLMVNRRIDKMSANRLAKHEDWNKKVVPQLEYNRYLKRFQAIRNDPQLGSALPAMIGKALMGVRGHPSVVWLLLSLNMDIVSNNFMADKESQSGGGSCVRHLPKKLSAPNFLDG